MVGQACERQRTAVRRPPAGDRQADDVARRRQHDDDRDHEHAGLDGLGARRPDHAGDHANFTDKRSRAPPPICRRLFGSSGATMNVGYSPRPISCRFSGRWFGPFSISYASTAAATTPAGAAAAKAAAQAAGFSTTAYKHVSIARRRTPICGWSGLAFHWALVVVDPLMRLDGCCSATNSSQPACSPRLHAHV